MAPPVLHVQEIRLDGVVKKVIAKKRNGQLVVMLHDVQDIFENARRFEYDGIGVPFMTDDDDERLLPLRVEYYEGCILDVVLGTENATSNYASAPIAIPSPPPITPTTPPSSFPEPTSPPVSVAPPSIVRIVVPSLPAVKESSEESPLSHAPSRTASISSGASSTPFMFDSDPPLESKSPSPRPSGILASQEQETTTNDPLNEGQKLSGSALKPARPINIIHTVHTIPQDDPKDDSDQVSESLSPKPVVYNPQECFGSSLNLDSRPPPQGQSLQLQLQHEQQRQQRLEMQWQYQQQLIQQNQQQPLHSPQYSTPHDQYSQELLRQQNLLPAQQHQNQNLSHHQNYQHQHQLLQHQLLQQQQHQQFVAQQQRQYSQIQQYTPTSRQSPPAYENLQNFMPDLQRPDYMRELQRPDLRDRQPSRPGSVAIPHIPAIPPRPHNSSTTSLASQSSATASTTTLPITIVTATPQVTTAVPTSDNASRVSLPLSPTSPTSIQTSQSIHSYSPPPHNPHVVMQHGFTHRVTSSSRHASISSRNDSDSGLDSASDNSLQLENEKVKDLEMQLRRARDQNLAITKKNHALTISSQIMSVKIMNKATLVQNKVQEVLTQNNELHENPIPRLFVVLPELIMDGGDMVSGPLGRRPSVLIPGTRTSQSGDQRKFRLYFLCECGSYTKPLPTGLNHIHFVDHEGYEIVKPTEFFQKYGAFIRSFSHLIRNGVNCGIVSIPSLLSSSQQQQYQQRLQTGGDANSQYKAYAVGQETLRNTILDTRLAEVIQYLDAIDTDIRDNHSDDGSPAETRIPFIHGKDIRQLQPYLKLTTSDQPNLGNLFRYVTNRGYVKWICEDHHKATVNKPNDIAFQQDISALGGQYDLRTGRAKIQLSTDKDAGLFYRAMGKVPSLNIYELDIGLRWAFTEGDLQRLVQAVIESKVTILTLDGGKQKADSSGGVKLINFGKKYDPLLKVIFSTKIQSLRIANMPSLITKLSLRQVKTDYPYSIKALHLTNVGALDFTSDKGHMALGMGLDVSGTRQPQSLVVKTLLTSFRSLTEISLPGMNIRDDGVQILTEMGQFFKTLRSINLSDNGITPAGGQQLAMFLAKERMVSSLDLGMNSIGDEVLATVIGSLGPKLSVLNLESSGFGDRAAKALEKMVDIYNSPPELEPQIEYLNLATNGWTTSGIQSLGRTIMKLRLEVPPVSPSMAAFAASASPSGPSSRPELGAAECFLLINSMIRTSQISLPTEQPWHETPNILKQYFALTATKDSYELSSLRAQDSIAANSRLKVLRLSDAGLTEGASRYLIGRLDVSVLTKLDLRRCIRLFKPREMLKILAQIYPSSSDVQDDYAQMQQHLRRPSQPQGPQPYGIMGTPRNCLRFVHLNSTGVDDHAARILASDLQSGYSCMERLDIGSNHLTHTGITMILSALCHNTSLQHLNLGQNFDTPNSVYASAAALAAQNTRETFARFMATNKTLEILYFTTMGVDVVAEGLKVNGTLRSLVFDRLIGGLKDVEAFGHALAINKTLMRFKVYDNRIAPFLQAFYGVVDNHFHHHGGPHQPGSSQIHYVDPFKDIKKDAIQTIVQGMSFNKTLIELQWPELFDKLQPWTERLETALMRNIIWLKQGAQGGVGGNDLSNGNGNKDSASISTFRGSRGQNGGMLSRGVSVLSTSSTMSTSSTNSSDSLSSMQNGISIATGGNGGGSIHGSMMINGNRGNQFTHGLLSSSPPQDGYSASVYSSWDERLFASLDLSPGTLNQLRKAPTREQQQQMAKVQQQQLQQHHQQHLVPRVEAQSQSHVMQRFQKK
ncbi:hypothetical protein BGZ81_000858 [Podila clonocystis]|nr:hypothetical protein BGZ81_000858 [Podila clonocystis]